MNVIDHSSYLTTGLLLKAEIDNFRPGHMIFLIGPSGVGKTTLRHAAMQEIFGDPMSWGRGRIPVIEVFATLPRNAYFCSRNFSKNLNEELHAPTLNWLFEGNTIEKAVEEKIRASIDQSASIWDQLKPRVATEADYWDAVQRCLPARSCKYVSVDQVTAFLVNHRDTSPSDHTLHLMSIAEASRIMFIMTGVHTATRLWAIHPELRRRVIEVWMPPYSDKRRNDQKPYLQLMKTLSTKYTFSRGDLLYTMANDILAASGGVFAEIIQLLERSKRRARLEGVAGIHKRHIQDSYYNNDDLKSLWSAIDAFELAMGPGNVAERSKLVATRWKNAGAKSMEVS